MPKKLHKSLRIYFSKLKKIPTPPTNSLLSACKYPKTPSFAADRHQSDGYDPAATLSDADRLLFENFHSLYFRDDVIRTESTRYDSDPPDVVRSSDRFFASPGTSNSLVEDARMSATSSLSSLKSSSRPSDVDQAVPGNSVAVMTFSKDPYDDFRRSMQDMVDERHVEPEQPLDWDFMEELLFCYLELNDRSVHKHILRAFTDLTVSFRRRREEEEEGSDHVKWLT